MFPCSISLSSRNTRFLFLVWSPFLCARSRARARALTNPLVCLSFSPCLSLPPTLRKAPSSSLSRTVAYPRALTCEVSKTGVPSYVLRHYARLAMGKGWWEGWKRRGGGRAKEGKRKRKRDSEQWVSTGQGGGGWRWRWGRREAKGTSGGWTERRGKGGPEELNERVGGEGPKEGVAVATLGGFEGERVKSGEVGGESCRGGSASGRDKTWTDLTWLPPPCRREYSGGLNRGTR